MSTLVFQTPEQLTRLAAAIAAAPLLAPTVHLFSNNVLLTPATLLTDLTECTFSGYAAVAAPFGTAGLDQLNNPVAPLPASFTMTMSTPGVAYGLYLLDSTGALVCATILDGAPYNFAVAGDQLNVTILFGLVNGTVTVAVGP